MNPPPARNAPRAMKKISILTGFSNYIMIDTWCACIIETTIRISSHNLSGISKSIP